jgi:hypothetical protein
MSKEPSIPQRNTFRLDMFGDKVVFDSNFDSGNLARVENRLAPNHFSIWTASDCSGMDKEGYSKSWFYFSVEGPVSQVITLSIHRLHVLYSMVAFMPYYS